MLTTTINGRVHNIADLFGCNPDPDESLREMDDLMCDECMGEGEIADCVACDGTGWSKARHADLVARTLAATERRRRLRVALEIADGDGLDAHRLAAALGLRDRRGRIDGRQCEGTVGDLSAVRCIEKLPWQHMGRFTLYRITPDGHEALADLREREARVAQLKAGKVTP